MPSQSIEQYKRMPFEHAGLGLSSKRVAQFIDAVNAAFKEDDIRLFGNGGDAELWLRQICMEELGETIQRLTAREADFRPLAERLQQQIAAIGSYGLNGRKRLYVGYNSERKVKGRLQKEAQRGKHYYAKGNSFSEANAILPAEYQDRILCGDSEALLKALPDNCVDAVVTSPPYNFGLDYSNADDDATDWQGYFAKLFAVLDECVRVLKHGGRMIINVQPPRFNSLVQP